ncbi:hypothetical protein ACFL4W_05755, partial [Planctomycetota bacterium]
MEVAGGSVLWAILMVLGFLNPQTLAPSDPAVTAGDGQIAAEQVASLIPGDPQIFLSINTNDKTLQACKELWIQKFFQINEINRTIQQFTAGTDRKNREAKTFFDIANLILDLETEQLAAALYADPKNTSVRLLVAGRWSQMETISFAIRGLGIALQGNGKALLATDGTWTRITTRRPINGKLDIALAVSPKAVLFEMALRCPPALIQQVISGDYQACTRENALVKNCAASRGDSRDLIFLAIDTPAILKALPQLNAKPVNQFMQIFKPAGFGRIVYTVKPSGKSFKEHFSVLESAGTGLLNDLISQSQPVDPAVFKLVPASAVFVQAGAYKLDMALDLLSEQLKNDPMTREAGTKIETFFAEAAAQGMDIRGRIINQLEGSGLLFITLPDANAGAPIPGFGFIAGIKDSSGIFEILEMVQNDNFRLSAREISGINTYTAQLQKAPFIPTFGTIDAGKKYFVIASSPDMFAAVVRAGSLPGAVKFAGANVIDLKEAMHFQFLDVSRLGMFAYPALRPWIPMAANKIPPLQGLNSAALPGAQELFGSAPAYVTVTTRSRGTETLSPIPLTRIGQMIPAIFPLMGHRFM